MQNFNNKKFEFCRNFARLGEFNSKEVLDGKHISVDIVRHEIHESWNEHLMINDIAIVYLAHDVTFTGNQILKTNFYRLDTNELFLLNLQIVSVPYVCQSVNKCNGVTS